MNDTSFFAELKRRKVHRVAVIYAVGGWLLVQIVTQVGPVFDLPQWAQRLMIVVIVAGFPLALILSWIYDLTPQGLVRSEEGDAPQRRRATVAGLASAAVLAIILAVGGWWIYSKPGSKTEAVATAVPETETVPSLAVLPFENRSPDAENAFFADGIQDEVLTRLAKIGSLRLISGASTKSYGPTPANLPKVAQELGVANLLRGSAQRVGRQVRINIQLIDAKTQATRWAEIYDREMTDALTVQSEVATAVAQALNAQLSSAEKTALAKAPTANPAAYDAYLRGRAYQTSFDINAERYNKSVRYYEEAVRLDPDFALAWAQLSYMHASVYWFDYDHTPERLRKIEHAAMEAARLQPELGEAFLALGYARYYGYRDYAGAMTFFEEARRRLPNDASVLMAISFVKRRQSDFDGALALQRQAAELDPRNVIVLNQYGQTLTLLPGRLAEAIPLFDRALNLIPDDTTSLAFKVAVLHAEGDLSAAADLLRNIPPQPKSILLRLQMQQLLYERSYAAVVTTLQAVVATPGLDIGSNIGDFYFQLSLAQRRSGDTDGATKACREGIAVLLALRKQGADSGLLATRLALLHAGVGEAGPAIAEADRAAEALKTDSFYRNYVDEVRAKIAVQLGETDTALTLIEGLLGKPYGSLIYQAPLTRNLLALDPIWDPLRADPRFQKLIQAQAP